MKDTIKYRCEGSDRHGFSLMQVPHELREAFVAHPGYRLVSLDISAQDFYTLAQRTNDENLIKDLQTGDLYKAFAARVYDKHSDSVTKEERQRAKEALLGYINGAGPELIARKLKITEDEARALFQAISNKYARIGFFKRLAREEGERSNHKVNRYGRIIKWDETDIDRAYSAASLYLQSESADTFKKALVTLVKTHREAILLVPLHDEVILEVPERNATQKAAALADTFSKALGGVKVRVAVGKNWKEVSKE